MNQVNTPSPRDPQELPRRRASDRALDTSSPSDPQELPRRRASDRAPEKKRRLRDRLVDREGTRNQALVSRYELQNLLLLVDDDLRETALALTGIEAFLADALQLLDTEKVTPAALMKLATRDDVLERMDTLMETMQSLRRRLAIMGGSLEYRNRARSG